MTTLRIACCLTALATLTAGCAITSSHTHGPNGRPVHYIDGITAASAYSKASELCPDGYDLLGPPDQKTPLDYVMTIECRAGKARP